MGLFARIAHRGPALAPLTPAPRVADLPDPLLRDAGRYLGTTAGGERVRARGLGSASAARIQLSPAGVDVVRLAGSFRIPADELRSARDTMDFGAGSGAPHGALVIRWQHGDQQLDTGFRLDASGRGGAGGGGRKVVEKRHRDWSRAIAKMQRSEDG